MSPTQIIKRKEGLPWQAMDDQALILVPELQEAHELNDTGCFIWQHLDGKNTVHEIQQLLANEYDVELQTISVDLEHMLNQFRQLNLVHFL